MHWELAEEGQADGSVWTTAAFDTVRGASYTLQASGDLRDWSPLQSFYAMGQRLELALFEREAAPSSPPGGGAPALPPEPFVSVSFQLQAIDDWNIAVTWPSLDDSFSGHVRRILPMALVPEWSEVPFYFHQHGDFHFFLFALTSNPVAAGSFLPTSDQELSAADRAAFLQLQNDFWEVQQTVVANHAAWENSPVPPPPSPQAKRFYRLAQYFPDSDGDGLNDAFEYAHEGALDPFDEDSDGDGIPDGADADTPAGGEVAAAEEVLPGLQPEVQFFARGFRLEGYVETSSRLVTMGAAAVPDGEFWTLTGEVQNSHFPSASYQEKISESNSASRSFAEMVADFSWDEPDPDASLEDQWWWGHRGTMPLLKMAEGLQNYPFQRRERESQFQVVASLEDPAERVRRLRLPLVGIRHYETQLGDGSLETGAEALYPQGEGQHRMLDFEIAAGKRNSLGELVTTTVYPLPAQTATSTSWLSFSLLRAEGLDEKSGQGEDVASGVDATSWLADPTAGGYQDKLWIMAPAGAENTLRLSTGASAQYPLELVAGAGDQVTPATLTQAIQTVKWTATGSEESERTLSFKFAGSEAIALPVGIKVMPRREIEVMVHPIQGQVTRGSQPGPDILPSEKEIQDYLDQVFEEQLNLKCHVTLQPTKVVNWDIADGRAAGESPLFAPHYPQRMVEADPPNPNSSLPAPVTISIPEDGKFDLRSGSRSPEQAVVIAATNEQIAHIHVYLMGDSSEMRRIEFPPEQPSGEMVLIAEKPLAGFADFGNIPAICWVDAEREKKTEASLDDVLSTLAHEIGHHLVGDDHPDEGRGVAPLQGSDLSHRLMLNGASPLRRNPTGTQLVKAEWDKFDSRIQDIVGEKLVPK
ncbi:hypothetical protein [Roseibacillus ishigakijimensis]|uniref:Uncharacterized protein n=1 Tax=Roseibacillus ishigakijimensis TaxID=454146 RepID=A0A934RKN6_9BACT|nr:hypothetical protein [Roseibacillus ishigakijimensis]MBK1832480.1 hypothetical protein [Roseibacillus ishigakijimensis]